MASQHNVVEKKQGQRHLVSSTQHQFPWANSATDLRDTVFVSSDQNITPALSASLNVSTTYRTVAITSWSSDPRRVTAVSTQPADATCALKRSRTDTFSRAIAAACRTEAGSERATRAMSTGMHPASTSGSKMRSVYVSDTRHRRAASWTGGECSSPQNLCSLVANVRKQGGRRSGGGGRLR